MRTPSGRQSGFTERTVGRMLAHLERHGRVERVVSFPARTRRDGAKRRVGRPYAKRKPKAYEVQGPGDLVQVDTLTPPRHGGAVGPGEVVKHFSAIDLFSRFSLAVVHRRATASLAAGFLRELVLRVPFPIRAVQVDGGSEPATPRRGVRSLRRPVRGWALGCLCFLLGVPS